MARGRRSLREPLNSQPRIVQLSATLCGAFSCLHHTPSIFGDQKALASLARALQDFTVLGLITGFFGWVMATLFHGPYWILF